MRRPASLGDDALESPLIIYRYAVLVNAVIEYVFPGISVAAFEADTRGLCRFKKEIQNRAMKCPDVIVFGSCHHGLSVSKRIAHFSGAVGVV